MHVLMLSVCQQQYLIANLYRISLYSTLITFHMNQKHFVYVLRQWTIGGQVMLLYEIKQHHYV